MEDLSMNNKPIMLTVLALFSIAFTSSCGRQGNNLNNPYGNGYYGVLNTNTPTMAGSVPVSAQRVSFEIQNAFATTQTISGGLVPFSPTSSGFVTSLNSNSISTSGTLSSLAGMNAYGSSVSIGVDGVGSMAAPSGNWGASAAYGFSPFTNGMTGTRLNIRGTITISATDAALMNGFQGGLVGSALSITSVGLMLNYFGNQLFMGQVYLYLNGTNHGYILQF